MSVTIQIKGVKKALKCMDEKTQFKVAQITLNKIGRKATTDVKQSFGQSYNITQQAMGIKFNPAKDRQLNASIEAPSKQIGLIKFKGVKQHKKGVMAAIRKGDKQLYQGYFIATMKSGHRGVFVRKTKKRLPIREQAGANFGLLLDSDYGRKIINDSVDKNAIRLFNQTFKYIVGEKIT